MSWIRFPICLSLRQRSRVASHRHHQKQHVANSLWCQEATEQGRLLDLAESDIKTLNADRIVQPTKRCRAIATWQAGNGRSAGSAGEPSSRARDDPKKGIGDIQV